MSDVTLLRKLTRKSTLKFGKYHDTPIGMLIDLGNINYLRWVYYNSSNITFFDDVLNDIKIPVEFRIQKPGCDSLKYDELKSFMYEKLSDKIKDKIEYKKEKIRNKNALGKLVANKNIDKIRFSKGSLARKNRGH